MTLFIMNLDAEEKFVVDKSDTLNITSVNYCGAMSPVSPVSTGLYICERRIPGYLLL